MGNASSPVSLFLALIITGGIGGGVYGIEKGAVMHGLGVSIYGGEGCMR